MNYTQPLSLLSGLGVRTPRTFWGHLVGLTSYDQGVMGRKFRPGMLIRVLLRSYFPLETKWLHPRVAAEIMEKQKGPLLGSLVGAEIG